MSLNYKYDELVNEYNYTLQSISRGEKINPLDLEFKEGAINAVEQARRSFDQELDFSEESLLIVEFILNELSTTIQRLELSEKWIDNMVQMYAGYIAWVIQLRWKGEWRLETDESEKNGPVLMIRQKAFFIPRQVRQRLTRGKEFSIVKYYESIKTEMEGSSSLNPVQPSAPPSLPPVHPIAGMGTGESLPEGTGMEWVINVMPMNWKEFFIKAEIIRILNPEWRQKAGFASGWVDVYGLVFGENHWRLLVNDLETPQERYSRLELRCNLFRIYYGKRYLNPKYLEIYLRTVQDLFAKFRFKVSVSPVNSFAEGVARIKDFVNQE